jgi:hypothetical protein
MDLSHTVIPPTTFTVLNTFPALVGPDMFNFVHQGAWVLPAGQTPPGWHQVLWVQGMPPQVEDGYRGLGGPFVGSMCLPFGEALPAGMGHVVVQSALFTYGSLDGAYGGGDSGGGGDDFAAAAGVYDY